MNVIREEQSRGVVGPQIYKFSGLNINLVITLLGRIKNCSSS